MNDNHVYYPERGWHVKWIIGGMIMFIALGIMIATFGCAKEGTPADVQNDKADFDVKHLFDVEKCSVYRFYDQRFHYFVTCKGGAMETREEYYRCGNADCYEEIDEIIVTSMEVK